MGYDMSDKETIKRMLALSMQFEEETIFDETCILTYSLKAQAIAPRGNGYWETTFRRDARRIQERRTR